MNRSRDGALYNLEFLKGLCERQDFQRFLLAYEMGFYSETVAMILDGPWNLPRYRSITDFELEVVLLPLGQANNIDIYSERVQ